MNTKASLMTVILAASTWTLAAETVLTNCL
jgi:hypothetical protein